MRKIILILFLLLISINADSNTTRNDIEFLSNIGSFLEPLMAKRSNDVTQIISIFGILLGAILTVLGYFVITNFLNVQKSIERNKKIIDNLKNDISKDVKYEVTHQIAYLVHETSQNIENHAYKKIDHSIQQIKNKVQQKLFEYQEFIYKVNQTKKLKYEKIIHDKTISVENMLKDMTAIQGHYNEICNHYAPKLFSDNIEDDLIPTAKTLSSEKDLHVILIKYLQKVYTDEDKVLQYHQKSKIKTLLMEYYNLKESDFKK